ncbi:MAG: AgmX/PglI C-terminal domain-containing protein [Xanthomonadaceae bacterium]|nr:AgmX/PglI C-terminal domain-containing protein [Xanthomonadaceae bacterium]
MSSLRKVIIEWKRGDTKQFRHWDGHAPIFISHPVRFILESTDNGARIRDLKSNTFHEKTWANLKSNSNLMSDGGFSIDLKPIYNEVRFTAAELKPLTVLDGSNTAAELAEAFKKSLIAAMALLALIAGVSVIWGNKEEVKEEELIPVKVAQLVLKAAPKSDTTRAAPAGESAPAGSERKDPSVVTAMRSKALQSSVQGLLKGGMSKLLADSRAMMSTGANSINAAAVAASGSAISVDADKTRGAVQVGALEGNGNGTNYSKGGKVGVKGQGEAFVSLDIGNSSVEEGLTKDEVGKVIHAHMSEVRYCYETAMIRNPSVEGKLMIDFVIGGNGRVKTASPKESSLKDPQLDDCIVRRLSKWEFPHPKGGIDVAVSYPFIFKSLGR